MSINAKLLALEPSVPGRAILNVRGWEEQTEQLEFAIQRNQDSHYLQHGQAWSSNPCWFRVDTFAPGADDESMSTAVGGEIVDPLLLCSANEIFNFKLRTQDGRSEDENPMRLAPGLISSLAGDGDYAPSTASTKLTPVAPPAEPDAVALPEFELVFDLPSTADDNLAASVLAASEPEPQAVTTTAPVKRSPLLWVLALLGLLLAIALGLWFLLKPAAELPAAAAPLSVPATVSAEPLAAAPCAVENMGTQAELQFVQGCVKAAPDSDQLLSVINSAKAGQHCGIAQRLYANRSQAGDTKVALAYAHEYDPKYHQASACFAEPDNATAAYWYETILSVEPDNLEAQQRLEELQP